MHPSEKQYFFQLSADNAIFEAHQLFRSILDFCRSRIFFDAVLLTLMKQFPTEIPSRSVLPRLTIWSLHERNERMRLEFSNRLDFWSHSVHVNEDSETEAQFVSQSPLRNPISVQMNLRLISLTSFRVECSFVDLTWSFFYIVHLSWNVCFAYSAALVILGSIPLSRWNAIFSYWDVMTSFCHHPGLISYMVFK